MYIYLLKKPIEFYHLTAYFAVFVISIQIFTNVMEILRQQIVCMLQSLWYEQINWWVKFIQERIHTS